MICCLYIIINDWIVTDYHYEVMMLEISSQLHVENDLSLTMMIEILHH